MRGLAGRRWGFRWVALSALLSAACADRSEPPSTRAAPASAALGAGSAARVSGEGVAPDVIATSTIFDIARAQRVSPADARERAVSDALFALEARRRKLDASHERELASVLARRLAADILAQAKAEGPVRAEEIDTVLEKRWWDLKRPEAFFTVHAIVMLKPDADPALVKRAEAVAAAIREAVLPVAEAAKKTPQPPQPASERILVDSLTTSFIEAAKAVPKDGLEVRLEQLVPIARDKYTVVPGPRNPYEPAFVAGATALQSRGDVSPPVRSSFGLHIIALLGRYPGHELSDEELATLLAPDVYDLRARKITDELLARLHKENVVDVERNADALLSQVRIDAVGMPIAIGPGPSSSSSTPAPLGDGPAP